VQQSSYPYGDPCKSKQRAARETTFPVELQVLQAPDIRLCILECHLLAPSPIPVYFCTHTPSPSIPQTQGDGTASQLSKRFKGRKEQVAKGPDRSAAPVPRPHAPPAPWPWDGERWPKVLVWDGLFLRQSSSAGTALGGNRRRENLLCRQFAKTALQSLALIFTNSLIAAIYLWEFGMQTHHH